MNMSDKEENVDGIENDYQFYLPFLLETSHRQAL